MTYVDQQIATSVLVIGTGGSGLRAAIELAERGIDVLIVGKRPKTDAHTTLAAAASMQRLATMDAEVTWQQHAADTITERLPAPRHPKTVQIVTEGAAGSSRAAVTQAGVHPDIAGFYDLAHAFDFKASAIAAQATLEAALERRETRGCHNRSDYPNLDETPNLEPGVVRTGPHRTRTPLPVFHRIFHLVRQLSTHGKLLE